MKILHVVGARPNFPKLAPVHRAGVERGVDQVILHTGQHYDEAMSTSFFESLGIPEPDVNLAVGSGSHAQQTARMIERMEPVLLEQTPDWVVVYGDVNSTLAAAVVASKIGQRLAHVEAGLRSDDRTMPEEINRLVTDRLASLLLTPSRDADARLRAEGEPEAEIVFVGNVMVDTLMRTVAKLGLVRPATLPADAPVTVTLHRPSNVDDEARLAQIVGALREVSRTRPVVFAVHPRTAARLSAGGVDTAGIEILGAIPYEDMLRRVIASAAVVTDSGGLQEETTVLGVPCLTLRDNTERPVTITEGTNQLVRDMSAIPRLVAEAASAPARGR
ncbi:MAG: UDP-N-acetylglucosamine 2-epimerase (non-hydrolyzing), partial [Gemmatimonadaceae bacterium]